MATEIKLPAIITDSKEAMAAEKEAINWEQVAKSYVIDSPEMAEAAAEDLKSIKAKAKDLDNLRTTLKKPSLEEGRAIDKHFKRPLDFLANAEKVLKGAIVNFQAAEQRRIEEEQRRINAEAEAERQRQEEERQERIAEAEAAGDHEAAAAISEELTFAPVVPQAEQTKLSGISTRSVWKGRVTDKMALIKAVAEGRADMALLEVNQQVLDGLAKALKGSLSIPGCEPFEDKSVSVRV
ncbi:hypothetical protein [Pseudomonas phage Itty13]|uniref:Uncharacterized protein n=1 Tax=Pseudomonas phage Itty13 TaxID=2805750 RepID=A0A889IR45_9CAUD|nr:hypothetical protein PQC19_gp69 [Pseudomonas phage Itty13]QRE00645.1 hypothetical protein [Pseudomonas phage Itty13]